MKKIIDVIGIALILASGLVYGQMTVRDSDSNVLMQVNDEGSTGSISLPSGAAPSSPSGKLYNQSGILYWDGSALGTASSAAGWTYNGTTVGRTATSDRVQIESSNYDMVRLISTRTTDWNSMLHLYASSAEDGVHTGGIQFGRANSMYESANMYFIPSATSSSDCRMVFGVWGVNDILTLEGTGNIGIGDASPTFKLDVAGKIGINDTQVLYLPDQTNFTGTLILGNGGESLSHTSGLEGIYNTAIGIGALYSHTIGYGNTATGYYALYDNTIGENNTAIGDKALQNNISGNRNVAVGVVSMSANTSGGFNTATGNESLNYNTGGNSNVASGWRALHYNTSGSYNVGIGACANIFNQGGSYNTIIGNNAGYNGSYHSKSGCVFIGNEAGYSETTSNKLYIDNSGTESPLLWGDFANNRLVINGNSTHNTNSYTFFVNGSAGGTGPWNNDSDGRMKKNIGTIPDALDRVQRLRGVNFEWKDTAHHEPGMQMGFIAQEAAEVVPEVVGRENDAYSMQYAPITALLVEAMKEQQNMISSLKAENAAQRRKNETLRLELDQLRHLVMDLYEKDGMK
ncbi:tail fiber domain-containing protein [bacterium]|nr:tail fiber domain-containing protein [bacterium]